MNLVESVARWQRFLLAALLAGSALLILPPAVEPFMLPKATFVVVGAILLLCLSAASAAWSRTVQLPSGPVGLVFILLAIALITTTLTSPELWTSLTGFYARYTGLVPYLAYLVVFLVALRLAAVPLVRLLARTAIVTLALVVAYGLTQAAGAEPFGFKDVGLGTTFSFFGNVNFSSAWVGAVSALALATAVARDEARGWRIFAAIVLPPALVYVVVTGTSQGLVVTFLSAGCVAAFAVTGDQSRLRHAAAAHRGRAALVGGGVLSVLLIAGLASLPFLRAQLDQALVERPEFWAAAVDIFLDHPVVGTGLDTYAHHFLAYRPASHAVAYGSATTDAPHSVPLGMFANGGVLLGLSYLAFVAAGGLALVRGARRLQGPARLAFGGVAGVWLGYQAQSLVSFDVPPLALLHFLSAGVLVAFAFGPTWRALRLPGQPVTTRRGRKGRPAARVTVPTSTRLLMVAVTLASVVAIWFTLFPLRADLVAASASPLTEAGRYDEAVERFQRAGGLNPGEASYLHLAALGLAAAGRTEEAVAAAAEAADRDPGTVEYPLFAARIARDRGEAAAAVHWFLEAVERDPLDPPVLNEAAQFLLSAGEQQAALEILERSVELRPDPVARALLEKARSGG